MLDGFVSNGVELASAAVDVKAQGFGAVEGAGATAPEDAELVAGLVDGAVAVDAFGNGAKRIDSKSRG